jgi:hypothetical protein
MAKSRANPAPWITAAGKTMKVNLNVLASKMTGGQYKGHRKDDMKLNGFVGLIPLIALSLVLGAACECRHPDCGNNPPTGPTTADWWWYSIGESHPLATGAGVITITLNDVPTDTSCPHAYVNGVWTLTEDCAEAGYATIILTVSTSGAEPATLTFEYPAIEGARTAVTPAQAYVHWLISLSDMDPKDKYGRDVDLELEHIMGSRASAARDP